MKTLAFAVLLAAAGTVAASDAKVAQDSFDGATRVTIDPHGLDCGMQMVCPLLGARWTSNRKDEAVLQVEIVNAYASIQGVQLNVDGEILTLTPLDQAGTRFDSNAAIAGGAPVARFSSRDYLVPLSLLPKLLAAQSVKLRVVTLDGTVDGTLSGGKKPSKALGALQRFVAKLPPSA